jgi:hypothetical protein
VRQDADMAAGALRVIDLGAGNGIVGARSFLSATT